MRTFTVCASLILCSLIALVGFAQKHKQREPCANALTQFEMNQCAAQEYQRADAELNRVYQQLVSVNKEDRQFIAKLRTAQKAWVSFRDAHMESIYPAPNSLAKYGSVFPMCYSLAQKELTVERALQLKRMLKTQEGDVCGWDVH